MPASPLASLLVLLVFDTTWKVSAPEGGANLLFLLSSSEMSYFETVALQRICLVCLPLSFAQIL